MKHFMLRSLMLLSLLCSTWGVGSAWAQLRDGGIYNFKNASATGQSMTITEYSYLIVATTNIEDEMQLWEADEVSTGVFTLRNLSNGKYLKSPNSSYNAYWTTVATVDDNCKFSCTAVGDGTYTMRATNSTNNYHYLYYGSGKIQCWTADVKASRWYITEKVTYSDADVPGALSNLFSDAACTQLKKSFANEAAIEADADYKKLPTELRNMVKKVYNNTWTENNYDGNKSAWDSNYAKKYRVQLYEPYNDKMSAATALGINWHTNMNNPTGIFANNGDKLYVMVEGTIKEGATLYIESYTGHGKLVDNYKSGQQLQPGLNIISCTADGSNYCINYIVETFDTSDGKRGNKAKARKLSDYEDLKIHIEGGYINGYYNKMGDDLYTPDKNADWDYIAARATQTDVTILGEYIVLQFPLNDADTEGNYGLNHYLTGKNIIEDVIDEWDKVMIWERLLLGVLDSETTADEAKKSPYSVTQSKDVFEYTGDDEGGFESGYGDYYNVHGLSFGVGGSAYMYGSGDHCGYHYNTMESIIQNILTNSGAHWGPGHEIGHQHQALLTVNGLTEVTNNLFSNVVLWYFGETTSRYNGTEGALSNVLAQFNTEGADFFSNNIWGQTIMYYKLFLYYHVLGHNPKFYPRLFEMLRQDPMSTGYEQDGSKCLMHFYKKCCLAAGEDLTEFFRAHGFFEVMDNRLVGDYSNSVYTLTQEQIDVAIKEVKALGYDENISVLFVTDATGEKIQSHKGDNLDLYGETRVCAELGSYANFNNNTASAYTATVSGTTVTMSSGEGGVGFAILNKKGELIGFSDKKTFELSLDAVEAILNGEANFVVVNGDATTTPATIEGNADERNKSLLGEMMESIKAFTNYEDANGKKIGYYKSSSLASMKAALEKAQEVYDNEEKTKYTAVFNALKQEYNAFLAADYNEIPMTAGTFILKNCSNNQHLYVNSKDSLALTNTAEANLDNTAKWVFEKTGAGKYYIKNLATGNYIGALAKSDNVPVLNTTGADTYDVVPMSNPGEFAIVYGDKLSFNKSYKGVIGWDYDGDRNSWWYITAVETDPADAQAVLLKELLENTQALYDQMAVTPIPQVIPLTESSYFSNALQKGGAYPSDNFTSYSVLCDGDPFTHFHSAYSGTNPGTHHYIRVDLGEEYKSDLFAFTYTNRSSNNRQNPTAITVEGSNEENGTYEGIVSLTTLDGLPTAEASSFESELLGTQGKAYRYLRFKVTETNSNAKFGDYPYFSITELGVLKGSFAITANSKYASNTITDAYMLEVFNALRQAKHVYRNATTADDYTAAYNALNAYYETLLNAYNDVKDADLETKKTELQTLIDNTTTLIGQCGSVKYTEETTPQLNVTEAPYMLSDNNGASKGSLDKLYDGLQGENNSYTSNWLAAPTDASYLQVDLGTGNELEELIFTFTNRNEGNAPTPTEIVVSASADGNQFTTLTTFTSEEANWPPAPNGQNIAATKWTSPAIQASSACRYWRFTVTKSQRGTGGEKNNNGVYHFGISEFGIVIPAGCKVTVNEGMGEVTEELLLATYDENQEAKSTLTYATTEAQLDKAIANLQAQYDALEAAKDNVYRQNLEAKIAETNELLDACADFVDGKVTTVKDAAGDATRILIQATYDQVVAAQALLNAGTATQGEYETATNDLEAQRATLFAETQKTTKTTLRRKVGELEALINNCGRIEDGVVVEVYDGKGDVSKSLILTAYQAVVNANNALAASELTDYSSLTKGIEEQYGILETAKRGETKTTLRTKVGELQVLIEACGTIDFIEEQYVVTLKEPDAGDVTKEQLLTAYQAMVNANNALAASELTDYSSLTKGIEEQYGILGTAQTGTVKSTLRTLTEEVTALITLCTNAPGDVSKVMLDDLTTANQEALDLLLTDDLAAIAEKTTTLQTQYTTVDTAQKATGKSTLSSWIDDMAKLISQCTTGEGETLAYVGDVTAELLNNSILAKDAALLVLNATNTTTADFEAATETLQEHYNTLDAAMKSTAKAELREKISELADLIEKCRIFVTNTVTRIEECELQTNNSEGEFYISTNATEYEGEIVNLVDDNEATFFQTKSSVGVEHYLLVDAGENNKLKKFKFSYRPCKSPFPYTIVVSGSNDNSKFTKLATFTDLPTTDDQNWESSEIGNGTAAYRYLRFNITKSGVAIKVDDNKELDTSVGEQLSNKYKNTLYAETPQVEYCFAMSEFALTNIVDEEQEIEILAGTVTEKQWSDAKDANDVAKQFADDTWKAEDLNNKTAALQKIYNALYAAYGLQVTLTLTDTRDKLLTGIDLGRQTIGTFSARYATLIPDGVTAYYATQEYSGGIVWLTRVETTVLPANQGVILIGEEGKTLVNFYPAAEEPQEDLSQNIFSNTASGPVTAGSRDFILANGAQGIGIYKAKEGITIGKGKAFIRLDAAAATQKLVLRFGGTTTDVDNVPTVILPEDTIYDLSGRRVNEVTKGGVYIVNGKKVFIK